MRHLPPAVPAMLIAFNKPFNVLCQFTDRSVPPRPTLAGFGLPPRVYAAGRLDHDSEGLLLLTDNGTLAHKLTDPKHKADKTYWVQVEGTPSDEQLQRLRDGVELNASIRRRRCGRGIRRYVSARPCLTAGWRSQSARAATARCGG